MENLPLNDMTAEDELDFEDFEDEQETNGTYCVCTKVVFTSTTAGPVTNVFLQCHAWVSHCSSESTLAHFFEPLGQRYRYLHTPRNWRTKLKVRKATVVGI